MDQPHRAQRWVPVYLALGAMVAGCSIDFEPTHGELEFSLNQTTIEDLAEFPDARAQIQGSLEMLFGTPRSPQFLLTDEWVDDGFNPNWPSYAADDNGSGEISEEEFELIQAENQVRFKRQLAAIEQGAYGDLPYLASAPALNARWDSLLLERTEALEAGEEFDEDTFREDAEAMFVDYYPSLIDTAELYRQQCLHCHGVEGGGDGPTSPYLDPLPRDYRRGVFKFTAVKDKARPRRADLYRILDEGVYTTAMPSFRRFSRAELHGLVDYVRLLAIRGEVEHLLTATVLDEDLLPMSSVQDTYESVWRKWQAAESKFFAYEGEVPAATPAMLARGKELFNDATTGNCASCHGELGLGNGSAVYKENDEGELVPAYQDDWGHDIFPRDLTRGVYRGGGRPIDIYRRIYAGINGGPMPALGESKNAEGDPLLSSDDLWSLVHYVRSLGERREPVRIAHGDHGHGAESDGHDGGTADGQGEGGGH